MELFEQYQHVAVRRSQRDRKPTILDDYMVYFEEVEYGTSEQDDPSNYNEAISSHLSNEWKIAMEEELMSMKHNKVWELVELPQGCKAVDCKWIYKMKRDSKGQVER